MIDLVLDIGIAADICLERGTHFAAALAAFEKAKTEGARIWLYTGSVQALQYVLANRLRRVYSEQLLSLPQSHELARRLIGRFSELVPGWPHSLRTAWCLINPPPKMRNLCVPWRGLESTLYC
jgi:hypothetical protein